MKTNQNKEFHVMEFVRSVRAEMNELYLQDKQKYIDALREASADYKLRRAQQSSTAFSRGSTPPELRFAEPVSQ
jgi:hypothetical protein